MTMPCRRCGGLSVPEFYDNLESDSVSATFRGRRCLNCGDIEDRVILINKTTDHRRLAASTGRGRRWP